MSLIVPQQEVWTRQPPGHIQAAKNELTTALCFLWSAAAGRDVYRGVAADADNTTFSAAQFGLTRQCALAQTNIEWNREAILTSDGAGTGDFTVAVLAKADVYNTAMEHLFAQKNDAGGAPYSQASLLIHGNGATGAATSGMVSFLTYSTLNTNANIAGAVRVGEWALYGGRRSGSTVSALADLSSASASGTIRDIANGSRRTAIGSRGNGTTESYRGEVAFAAAWNRALSDAEWKALADNPWQLFEPEELPVLVALGAGAVDITGAATDAADTASGSVTSEWDVSGAVTDGSDTASGSITAEHDIAGAATDGSDTAAGEVTTELDISGAATDSSDTAAGVLLGVSLVTGDATDGADIASGVISNPEARRAEQPAGRPSKDRKRRRVIVNDTLYEVPERDIPALIEAALRNSTPPGTAEEVATPKAAHPITRKASRKSQPVVIEQPTIDDIEQRAEALRVEFAAQAHIDMLAMLDRISARVLIELQDEDDALTALLLA